VNQLKYKDKTLLKEVSSRLETIEKLAREIEALGATVPAIAKNARILLAATYVMRFGTSDVAELS
jgi:uncharacterized protein YoxC